MKLNGTLLGFRSGVPWKKIVAVLYYLLCFVILITGIISEPIIPADAWDMVVYKISVVVIFLWLLSPALFLSNTPLRSKLPLFKLRTKLHSLLGMMIVFLVFSYLFAMVESWHSPEYKSALDTYHADLLNQFSPSAS